MPKRLVIVESPTKARTIARYLGPEYVVESSVGHVRDLPSTAKEIPDQYKAEKWARTGVDVEHEFRPLYIVPPAKREQVKRLKSLLANADELYLATDEDREGEAIAWHLTEVLKPKVPVKRMVFHEITEQAIREALANPREVDIRRVDAQEARRILDRLYGYEVSPVLWKKVRPRLSAGRVQSVAVRLVVDRERERMRFVSADYWDIEAELATQGASPAPVLARLVELGGKRIATGKDFEPATGALARPDQVVLLDEQRARQLAEGLHGSEFRVASVEEKPFTQRPYPPFITSTLQQEAGRKLRYTAKRTMSVAQRLYENGHITYMRTDSTNLSTQAIEAARSQVVELYGKDYLPEKPRQYTRKVKGAQEAHEAIRPAGDSFRTPESLRRELRDDPDALSLYELIWKRTVASQMKDATGARSVVRVHAPADEGAAAFQATGKVIHFPGFLRAYVEGSDDPEAELADQERVLPAMATDDRLDARELVPKGHSTQPPARFTEASLVKELEERGIGRPSTYASIIQTIQDRGYVWKKRPALIPTLTAFAVSNLMEKHFPDLVDFDFTARMESDLDEVAAGERERVPWLHRFYFGEEGAGDQDDVMHVGLKRRVHVDLDVIDAREVSSVAIGQDASGRGVFARVGRYGPYLQIDDSDARASLPDDLPLDELGVDEALERIARAGKEDTVLGQDPETGKPVYLKDGRFGPYVQLGDAERTEKGALKKGGKPKMASLWPTMVPAELTLEQALDLLAYPKPIGVHPETGEEVVAAFGRYGPYVKSGNDTRSLESYEQLASLELDEALKVLAQPKRGRAAAQTAALKTLGQHPSSGAPVELRNGRFGPYVTDGVVNASVPKGRTPEEVGLDDALELIANREEKLRAQGKDPRAAKPAKKKPAAKKKAPAKKKATKKKAARKKAPAGKS